MPGCARARSCALRRVLALRLWQNVFDDDANERVRLWLDLKTSQRLSSGARLCCASKLLGNPVEDSVPHARLIRERITLFVDNLEQ